MNTYTKNQTVRSLVEIQIPGWKTVCAPGYHFTVEQVNDDGTLVLFRSGPDGKVTVKAGEVEPAYKVCNGISYIGVEELIGRRASYDGEVLNFSE